MAKIFRTTACLVWFFAAQTAFATTYYIAANGADTNNGTAQATPWLHAPGMPNCSSTCASYKPVAGDQLIFRGGDIWHFGNSAATPYTGGRWYLWPFSGTSSSMNYIGVDQTWYNGTFWTRPVFDADNHYVSGTTTSVFQLIGDYVIIDNIEERDTYWDNSDTNQDNIFAVSGSGDIIKNVYIHAWSHYPTCAVPQTCEPVKAVLVGSGSNGVIVDHVLVDGTDSTNGGDSMGCIYDSTPSTATAATVQFSTCRNVSDGIVGALSSIHDSAVARVNPSFDPGNHGNCIETLGSSNTIFYNNVTYHCEGGVSWLLNAAPGGTDWVYDNVMYDTPAVPLALDTHNANTSFVVFNNTFDCSLVSGQTCIRVATRTGLGLNALTVKNAHFVTTNATPICTSAVSPTNCEPVVTLTTSNNVSQTLTQANSQGYSASQTYAYSPTSTSNATVGAGANLGGLGVLPLDSDTSYGYTRASVARPSAAGTTWDAGAYQFGSGASTSAAPNPPQSLVISSVQ